MANVNIDASQLEDVKCEQCGNFTFESVFLLKKVPAVLSNTGRAGIAPIPVFACNACGNINKDMIPRVKSDENESSGPPKIEIVK